MKSRSAMAAAAAAALCLCACPQGNSLTPGNEPVLGDTTLVLAYRVSGDSLHTPAYDRIVHYCEGDSFRIGTYPQDAYALEFSVTGNALRTYHDPVPQTSGALVQVFRNYARIGSGKGLEGLWKYGAHGYRVLSGVMSKYESDLYAEGVRKAERDLAYADNHLRFADGKITNYLERREALRFADLWQTGNAIQREIDAKAENGHTVAMKGRISGETVRITFGNTGDRIFASDNPAHAGYRFYDQAIACPNELDPPWFVEFLTANTKPVP